MPYKRARLVKSRPSSRKDRGQRNRGRMGRGRRRRAGRSQRREPPHSPASVLASLKRRTSEKKWKEAQEWSLARIKNQTKRLKQTTDPRGAKAHCSPVLPAEDRACPATHMKTIKLRTDNQCWCCQLAKQTPEHLSSIVPRGELSKRQCGPKCRRQRSGRNANGRWPGERCSEAILEFRRKTDVGRKVPTEKATEAESSESGTEQECPRHECVCGLCRSQSGIHSVRFPTSNFPLCTFYLAGSGAASDW